MTLILFSAPFSSRTHPCRASLAKGQAFVSGKNMWLTWNTATAAGCSPAPHTGGKNPTCACTFQIVPASSAVFTHAVCEECETRPGRSAQRHWRSKQADVSDEGGGFEPSKGIWVTPWDKYLTDRLTSVTKVITGTRSSWPIYESTFRPLSFPIFISEQVSFLSDVHRDLSK